MLGPWLVDQPPSLSQRRSAQTAMYNGTVALRPPHLERKLCLGLWEDLDNQYVWDVPVERFVERASGLGLRRWFSLAFVVWLGLVTVTMFEYQPSSVLLGEGDLTSPSVGLPLQKKKKSKRDGCTGSVIPPSWSSKRLVYPGQWVGGKRRRYARLQFRQFSSFLRADRLHFWNLGKGYPSRKPNLRIARSVHQRSKATRLCAHDRNYFLQIPKRTRRCFARLRPRRFSPLMRADRIQFPILHYSPKTS